MFQKDQPAEGVVELDALKSDTVDIPQAVRAIYVGSIAGGDAIKLTADDGSIATFSGLMAPYVLPVKTKRVWSTGTTASGLVGLM